MKLPFLVYGARDGYGWLNGTEWPLAFRERLRRAAGKLPDFDIGEPGSAGVVNCGEHILIYRFMREMQADSKGRNAACLAMAFFPRTQAATVNAEAILLSPLFLTPTASSPPDSIDFADGSPRAASWHLPGEQAADGIFSQDGSLAAACPVFSDPFSGTLRIMRKDPEDGQGARYSYQPPSFAHSAPAPAPTPTQTVGFQPQPGPVNVPNVIVTRGCPWPALGLIAAFMFLAGYLARTLLPPDTIKNLLQAGHATPAEQTPVTNAVPSVTNSAGNAAETRVLRPAILGIPADVTNSLPGLVAEPGGEESP